MRQGIEAIRKGPRALRMYMEMCAHCGTCASVCPVYYARPEKRYNPAERSDLIRRVYKKHCTASGRLLGRLAGAEGLDGADLERWAQVFYE